MHVFDTPAQYTPMEAILFRAEIKDKIDEKKGLALGLGAQTHLLIPCSITAAMTCTPSITQWPMRDLCPDAKAICGTSTKTSA